MYRGRVWVSGGSSTREQESGGPGDTCHWTLLKVDGGDIFFLFFNL